MIWLFQASNIKYEDFFDPPNKEDSDESVDEGDSEGSVILIASYKKQSLVSNSKCIVFNSVNNFVHSLFARNVEQHLHVCCSA